MTIEPFEHWCADGCGEILEDRGVVQRVRRWRIQMSSGEYVGNLFNSEQEAQEFVNAHSSRIS